MTLEVPLHTHGNKLGMVVLGMHRSGTSAAAHLFGELGFSFGGDLLEPQPDNPRGYWEHAEIVAVHNEFLASFERPWDDPRPLREEDLSSAAAAETTRRLEAIFERDFAGKARWILKDPRLCRLLPLWRRILDRSDARLCFLHLFRHPLSVARSLAAREGSSLEQGLLLWLRHTLEGERHTRPYPRAWLSFERLIQTPSEAIGAALEHLGLDELFETQQIVQASDRVLAPSEVHHRAPSQDDPLESKFPWVQRVYATLLDLERSARNDPLETIDAVRDELRVAERLLCDGLLKRLEAWRADLLADRRNLLEHLEVSKRYSVSLREALDQKEEHYAALNQHAQQMQSAIASKDETIEQLQQRVRQLEEALQALPSQG